MRGNWNRIVLKSTVFLLFIISLALTISGKYFNESSKIPESFGEQFDRSLLSINSQERMDSLIQKRFINFNFDTAKTVFFLDQLIRNRFYHSYSHLSLKDNWIADICGRLFWIDFSIPVCSEDIIKFPMAACSQQGIVFQHQLQLLKIPCKTIEFKPNPEYKSGHYAVCVFYDNSWHFYDSNQEPIIVDSLMPSVEKIVELKLYEKMYTKPSNIKTQNYFKNPKYFKRVDAYKNGEMAYFQRSTKFLSDWLWVFSFIFFIVLMYKDLSKKRVI